MHRTEFRDLVATGALVGYAIVPLSAVAGTAAAALNGEDVAERVAVTVSAVKERSLAIAGVVGVGGGLFPALAGEDISGAEVGVGVAAVGAAVAGGVAVEAA